MSQISLANVTSDAFHNLVTSSNFTASQGNGSRSGGVSSSAVGSNFDWSSFQFSLIIYKLCLTHRLPAFMETNHFVHIH